MIDCQLYQFQEHLLKVSRIGNIIINEALLPIHTTIITKTMKK